MRDVTALLTTRQLAGNATGAVAVERRTDELLVVETLPLPPHVARTLEHLLEQARANELIGKGDGYTLIAAQRSPDLRHTEKQRRHLCYCGNEYFLSKMCNFRTLVTETTSDESSLLR